MKKMPKFLVVFLAVLMVVYHLTCFYFIKNIVDDVTEDKIVLDLPDYCEYDFYRDGVWREHIDYAKYYYHNVDLADLKKSDYLEEINEDNIEEVQKYINDFSDNGWLFEDGEIKQNYDFQINKVEIGDYFYVSDYASNGKSQLHYPKYKCYDLYIFDVESQTLYFFDKFV